MRRPQPLVEQTTCTQTEPTIDGNGRKSSKQFLLLSPLKLIRKGVETYLGYQSRFDIKDL